MEQSNDSKIIPALLVGAAAYFGLTNNGSSVADLTREAVGRLIDTEDKQKKYAGKKRKNTASVTPVRSKSRKRKSPNKSNPVV